MIAPRTVFCFSIISPSHSFRSDFVIWGFEYIIFLYPTYQQSASRKTSGAAPPAPKDGYCGSGSLIDTKHQEEKHLQNSSSISEMQKTSGRRLNNPLSSLTRKTELQQIQPDCCFFRYPRKKEWKAEFSCLRLRARTGQVRRPRFCGWSALRKQHSGKVKERSPQIYPDAKHHFFCLFHQPLSVYISFWRITEKQKQEGSSLIFYYINRNTSTNPNNNNEIHTEDCEYLPSQHNREPLGSFNNCWEALEKARISGYPKADGCTHCCTPCNQE